jgi:hypothetical protein
MIILTEVNINLDFGFESSLSPVGLDTPHSFRIQSGDENSDAQGSSGKADAVEHGAGTEISKLVPKAQ